MTAQGEYTEVGRLIHRDVGYEGTIWLDGFSSGIQLLPNTHKQPHTRQPDFFMYDSDLQRIGSFWRGTTRTGGRMLSGEVQLSGLAMGVLVLPNNLPAIKASFQIFARTENVQQVEYMMSAGMHELSEQF